MAPPREREGAATYLFWLLAQTVQNFNLYSPTPPFSPSWVGVDAAGTAATAAGPLAASIFFDQNTSPRLFSPRRDQAVSSGKEPCMLK